MGELTGHQGHDPEYQTDQQTCYCRSLLCRVFPTSKHNERKGSAPTVQCTLSWLGSETAVGASPSWFFDNHHHQNARHQQPQCPKEALQKGHPNLAAAEAA